MDRVEVDKTAPYYGTSAYVRAFDDTVAFALEKNCNLWNEHELARLQLCSKENMPEGARLLLSRLSLRKAKWMKSYSISHYVVYKGRNLTNTTDTDGGLLQSIETLKKHSFLEILQSHSSFELAFEAVQACFLLDDLTRLYKRLTTNKNTTSNNKIMSKEELLNAIHHAARTQRTLFGQSLSHKFASAVLEVVKESSASSVWSHRNNTANRNGNNNPSRSNKSGMNTVILRINPETLHLLRRCQRLYQISCNAGSSGYSNTTTTTNSTGINYNATGAAAANNTSAATTGFASVLTPLDFNAPLLVMFNKTRYPEYSQLCMCTLRTHSAGCGVSGTSASVTVGRCRGKNEVSSIFQSQRSFRQWEGAVELHAACLDQGIQDLLLNAHGQEKLMILVDSFQSTVFLQNLQPVYCDMTNSATNKITLYELVRLCGLTWVRCPHTQNAIDTTISDATTTVHSNDAIADAKNKTLHSTSKANASVKSRASNTSIDLTSLSSAHLLAILCMLSYASKHCNANSADTSIISTMKSETELDDNINDFADHMLKFDAGTQLAYACSDAATAAEKEPHRQYTLAILLFELLLALPYLPHRRGYWYKRLCIDYSHLQLFRCALRACRRCLGDSLVNVSDKTDLASRATSLQQKILKQHSTTNATATATNKKANGRNKTDETDVVVKSEATGNCAEPKSEFALFNIEKDFPTVLAFIKGSITESTADTTTSDITLIEQSSVRKRKSRATQGSLNTTIDTNDSIAAQIIETSCSVLSSVLIEKESALPVLCMINILPIEPMPTSSIPTSASTHSLLEVLYNALLRAILHSPHANSTDTTNFSSLEPVNNTTIPVTTPTNSGFTLSKSQTQNLEIGKRKLTTSTTTIAAATGTPKLSRSHTTGSSSAKNSSTVTWACTVCTFLNTTERFCTMCMTARVVTTTIATTNNDSTASTKTVTHAPLIVTQLSTSSRTTSQHGKTSSCVVDLVSDDEDNNEVEIIDILTPTNKPALGNTKEVQQLEDEPFTNTAVFTTTTESNTSYTMAKESETINTAGSSVNRDVVAIRAHLDTIFAAMLRDLHSLILSRSNVTNADNSDTLANALNLSAMSGDGEEEDDLLLLGLLSTMTITLPVTDPANTDILQSVSIKEEASQVTSRRLKSESSVRPSLEDLIPAPPFFVVTGKRTGDPASRKGKSKFCGLNDELVNVETYVMQKCHIVDPDDCIEDDKTALSTDDVDVIKEEELAGSPNPRSNTSSRRINKQSDHSSPSTINSATDASTSSTNKVTDSTINNSTTHNADKKAARRTPYTLAIDNGGWQGWHCEGSIFKTLFGLLMWDVLFSCPICSNKSKDNGSSSCSMNTTSTNAYCVFVTPFQDAPLDLGHRSFYRTRRVAIQNRIAQIASLSTQQMITALGEVYRKHYGENCRGVQWSVSLPLLQLMAVCMGNVTVARVCNALSVNYKHFTGGAPDLMLIRVQRRVVRTDADAANVNGGRAGNVADSTSSLAKVGDCIDNVQDATASVYPVTDYTIVPVQDILGYDWQEQLSQPVVLPKRSTADASERFISSDADQETDTVDIINADEIMEVDVEVDNSEVSGDSYANNVSDSAALQEEPNAHFRDLFLPRLAPTPDTEKIDVNARCVDSTGANCPESKHTDSSYTYEYKLEARFIEVKGPTDSLMFRQRVWLHILNSSAARNDKDSRYTAYVCHVKED